MARSSSRLSTSILRTQIALLFSALLVGFALSLWQAHNTLVHQFEQRALAIANTVTVEPGIADLVRTHDPLGIIQQRAEAIRHSTGALFVVITDDRGVRFSHPSPDRIGQVVSTDPDEALSGKTVVNVERGTLGLSARAKVPLRADDGAIAGEVSVGIDAEEIESGVWRLLPSIALYSGIALAVGVVGSILLSRRLKRQTFGLELREIATLLQEREAMLHGVAEGVIGLGSDDRIALINDEARRLLDVPDAHVGAPVAAAIPAGRVRDILTGDISGSDLVVVTDQHFLVVNRMPVHLQGRDLGHVVTVSDRTEQEGLLRELNSVRGLTDALRAQQHEFANRVHALSGMLELGAIDEATAYVAELSTTATNLATRLQQQIASPQLVGLLVAKSVVAGERGIALVLTDESELGSDQGDSRVLLTVLGNLVDNAIDAAVAGSAPGRVEVDLRPVGETIRVRVSDSGPGIPPHAATQVFDDGFTTKPDDGVRRRGLGLALVHRIVVQHSGTIAVSEGPGAVFTVELPLNEPAHHSAHLTVTT
ncbi:sensor histidine kinase [Microbacterium terrisoli]|uniref:sensor histidine kinase n=1 Tax=Microbacterium terrisoli TaxID=3242192 RepID=UPI002803D387|nr:sensor histidine kinase [Microbacterium protaetiae]